MDDAVTAELEALEELCLGARDRPPSDDARTSAVAYACGALATLVHLGLITPEETHAGASDCSPRLATPCASYRGVSVRPTRHRRHRPRPRRMMRPCARTRCAAT